MIHHTCKHSDPLKGTPIEYGRMTSVVMDYAGRYRCPECKRRVEMEDVDAETWKNDLKMLPRIEPPYREGICR